MAQYKVGDTIVLQGQRARVVWLRENPLDIEAMDEYIVEFENNQRRFVIASELENARRLCA